MDASGPVANQGHRDSIPDLLVDKIPAKSSLDANFDDDADIDDADMADDFPDEVKGFGGGPRGVQSTKVNQMA